jgi:hypothetical protein
MCSLCSWSRLEGASRRGSLLLAVSLMLRGSGLSELAIPPGLRVEPAGLLPPSRRVAGLTREEYDCPKPGEVTV